MRKYFEQLIARKKAEMEELQKKSDASSSLDEVRSIGETLKKLRDEINDAEEQLKALEDEPANNGDEPANAEPRGLNPMATYGTAPAPSTRSGRDSMDYRQAFMDYVQRGTRSDILQYRNDTANQSTDLGVLLPTTVVDEIIKGVEKVYGQLYSRVKKTNIKGGVKYPIGSFDATFHRMAENGAPTGRQKGGSITGSVDFTYKLGEIRIAQTLLANVLSVPVFENELAKTIVEAYVKAMDEEILNGDPNKNQMEGIITEANKVTGGRIPAENIIEFTKDDMANWTAWQTKLFAKIPLSMRALRPEFVMTPATYEANIKTMKDNNNRPVYNETFNPVDGAETATFKGKEVVFVEDGEGIHDFDEATNGQVFGLYWIPEKAYAINTNLEFAVTRYFDNEKLQYVDRAVVINDGKILDPKYLYVLKKKIG